MSQRLLIVTYYWPPGTGPGVYRWLHLSKYLARSGWEVHVLTVKPSWARYQRIDLSLFEQVEKSIRIHRTIILDATTLFSPSGKHQFNKVEKKGFTSKILNYIRSNFFIPDARIGWRFFAVRKGLRIIKKYQIDYIITTAPPHSTHLIGKKLKDKSNAKWFTDFRDPWNGIFYENDFQYSEKTKKKHLRLEYDITHNCDGIICVGEKLKSHISQINKLNEEKNISVIHNGFDPEIFENAQDINRNDQEFIISYVGTITYQYDPESIFKAISILPDPLRKKIVVQFIGTIDEEISELLDQFPEIKIKKTGVVEHYRVKEYLQSSDLLLLIIPNVPNSEIIITGKLFEYLASGKRILCLGPENGEVAEIISVCNAGITTDRSGIDKIRNFIESEVNFQGKSRADVRNWDKVKIYSRNNLADKLSEILLNS